MKKQPVCNNSDHLWLINEDIEKVFKRLEAYQVHELMQHRRLEGMKRLKQVKQMLYDMHQFEELVNSHPGWYDYKYGHFTHRHDYPFDPAFTPTRQEALQEISPAA